MTFIDNLPHDAVVARPLERSVGLLVEYLVKIREMYKDEASQILLPKEMWHSRSWPLNGVLPHMMAGMPDQSNNHRNLTSACSGLG